MYNRDPLEYYQVLEVSPDADARTIKLFSLAYHINITDTISFFDINNLSYPTYLNPTKYKNNITNNLVHGHLPYSRRAADRGRQILFPRLKERRRQVAGTLSGGQQLTSRRQPTRALHLGNT